jgi:hypothetical protein
MNASDGRGSALVAIALLAGAVLLYVFQASHGAFHALPLLQPDSATYLDGNIARSPAYPLLLRLARQAPGGLASIGPLQHVAVLASCVFLASSFAALYGRALPALGLAAVVAGNPALISYCYTILPEAFFMAALMVHLGCVLRFARSGGMAAGAATGASAAAAALFKPVGFAAVAALAVLAVQHRQQLRSVAALGTAAMGVVLAAALLNFAARGVFATESQGGYSRAAYVGVLLEPTAVEPYGELTRRIGERAAPHRAALFSIADPEVAALVGSNEYHVMETVVHDEILDQVERDRGSTVGDRGLFPRDPGAVLALDRIGGWLAGVAIRQHPMLYARMVASNVAALWWQPLVQSPSSIGPLQARIDEALADHPVLGRPSFPFRIVSQPAYFGIRLTLAAAVACALAGLAFVLSGDRRRQVLGHVSVLLHGYFVGVSATQPGLPRYAVAVWPASMLVVFGTAAVVARRFAPRER